MAGSKLKTKTVYGYKLDFVLIASETHEYEIDAGVNNVITKISYIISDYTGAGAITITFSLRAKDGTWFEASSANISETSNAFGNKLDMFPVNEMKVIVAAAAGTTAKITVNLLVGNNSVVI